MRRATAVTVLVATLIAGCGGGDELETESSAANTTTTEELTPAQEANEAAIAAAESVATTRKNLKAYVLEHLNAEYDIATCKRGYYCSAGVPASQADQPIKIGSDIKVGKSTCFVDSIFVGDNAGFTNEYLPLYAPDGTGGIVIGLYEDSEEADCLKGFARALDWR